MLILKIIYLVLSLGIITVYSSPTCTNPISNTRNCTVDIFEQVLNGTLVFNTDDYFSDQFQIIFDPQSPHVNLYKENFQIIENKIYTSGDFDRESMVQRMTAPFPVSLVVNVVGLPSQHTIRLSITVIDKNDNVPKFQIGTNFYEGGDTYDLMIYESPSVSNILNVKPVDYDEGVNGTSLVTLGQTAAFNMSIQYVGNHPSVIEIYPIAPLNREDKSSYMFQLNASEGTANPTSAVLNINVTVLDVNDNLPQFQSAQYSVNISEMSAVNTTLVQVHADDADIGTNAAVSYAIGNICAKATDDSTCLTVNHPWPFALDTESGLLRITEMLNYEEVVSYRLTVEATNPNEPNGGSSTAIINIEILDINDNAPEVRDFSGVGSISEKAAINSVYATFKVKDADSAPFSQYELSLFENNTNKFNISTTFGLQSGSLLNSVILLRKVDREEREQYNLFIKAQDSLSVSLYTIYPFTITITDDNDHYPVFDTVPNPVIFKEGNSVNTLVFQVSATDEDIGINAAIIFKLPPQSNDLPYQNNFTMESNTGKLLAATLLDRETSPELYVRIQAIDENGLGLVTNLTLNISLTDINDNSPVITSIVPTEKFIKENVTVGTEILDIDASDADNGTNAILTYSLNLLSPSNVVIPFIIKPTTGKVIISHTLDRETTQQYSIQFSVTDGATPPAVRNLTIIVQDINDNNPYFSTTKYFKTLHENVTINSHVITLEASDADSAQFTNIYYSLISGSSDFHLNTASGEITTAVSLDWEAHPTYTLVVRAHDGYGRHSTADATITIDVVDVNDEIPKFIGAPYVFNVSEGSGSNAYVGQVTVQSIEHGDHGAALFYLNSDGVPFLINQTSGEIHTTVDLNRETKDLYEVSVRVEDAAPPPHYNTTTVKIVVTDVNDNPPVFDENLVQISLSELQAVNTPFYVAHATDMDLYPNNITKYYVADGTAGFQINSDSGELILTSSLDYETQQSIVVTIVAKDNGKPETFQATQQINITILDDNNTNITFPSTFPLEYQISEDISIGSILINFTGQDHKGNPKLHLNYYLTYQSGGVPSEFGIEVESLTGYALLTTTSSLDRETHPSYALNITITDQNTPPSKVTQFLTVTVLDINDNDPTFLLPFYTFSTEEEINSVKKLGTVEATDPDSGENGTVSYSLVDSMSGLFSIGPNSGDLYQQGPLDRETKDQYTLTVKARDNGNPVKETQKDVTIILLDINDNPPSFSPLHVSVEENIKVGTIIANLTGHDADIGSNGEVTFLTNNQKSTATSHFQLLNNGSIRVIQVPDYETQTEFIFYLIAQDGGTPPLETSGNFTININDLNDNCPTFIGPPSRYNISVPEDTPEGSILLNITAYDLDQGAAGIVNYRLENFAYSHQFFLNSGTGLLTLEIALDYEVQPHYEIGIFAYDEGRPRNKVCKQTVHIDVININEYNPSFDKGVIILAVDEGLPSGSLVDTVHAYDGDSNSILSYVITDIRPAGDFFTVSKVDGAAEIRTHAILDYNTEPFYNMTLKVTDEGGRFTTAFLIILVNNINDHDPIFSTKTYAGSVPELTANGTIFMSVSATDKDNNTNTAVTYSITGGNDGNAFSIDPLLGEISVNGALDYETTNQYILTVQADDTGVNTRSATANVVISILNVNEYTPQFPEQPYNFFLTEELPNNTFVGQVTAIDQDDGNYGNIKYSFQPPSSLFSIDSSTGIIRTRGPIDREATPTLPVLTVVANDSSKTSTKAVQVTLVDINDNPPSFPLNLYELSVDENAAIGSTVGSVIAIDPDVGFQNTQYTILTNQTLPFEINSTTGVLRVTQSLAGIYTPYKFSLVATDINNSLFTDQTIVRVYAVGPNDHQPNFTQQVYHSVVKEGLPLPSGPIVTVTANDPDTGSNGFIKYSFVDDSLSNNQFSINSLSGEITLTQSLDYEEMMLHDLIVYAKDSTPSHPRTATAHVLVAVTNVNDNPPTFTNFPPSVSISYVPYTGLQLFQLSAMDLDNSPYTFQLWSQTNKFDIDPVTGFVTNKIVLNSDVSYSLEFRVSDNNYTTSNTTTLTVTTPPNNAPSFTEPEPVLLAISEAYSVNKTIRSFTALNNPNGYYIVCCDDAIGIFNINSLTGAFSISSHLDYESLNQYQLVIEARKVENGVRYSDYLKVNVSVTNINEHTPQFSGPVTVTINENTGGNALVVQVKANDPDLGSYGSITYEIIDGNQGDAFDINSNNGAIRIASGKTLNRESVPEYSLLVKAVDGGGLFSNTKVTVIILDENDSPPVFPHNYSIGVYEPASSGDQVLRVEATDPDIDSQITYHLGNVNAYHDNTDKGVATGMFSIHSETGVVSLTGQVDYENVNRYTFTVSASDTQHTSTADVVVYVLDINDKVPDFLSNNYAESLYELSSVGTSLVKVTANDGDSYKYSMIRYSLNGNWSHKFSIDEISGTIRVKEPLAYNDITSSCFDPGIFTMTVYASDGGHTVSATISVTLIEINNYPPVFLGSPYNVVASETAVIDDVIISNITIQDLDCGQNRYITTTFSNIYYQPKQLFKFEGSNFAYKLKVKNTLPQGVYHFRLEAENNRPYPSHVQYYKAGYADVKVTVLPYNAHSPIFDVVNGYNLTVYENTTLGTTFGQVWATDSDLGISGSVFYYLVGQVPFIVSKTSGEVSVNGSLDRETRDTYSFIVTASDQGYPVKSTNISVLVRILDNDDNPPVFVEPIYFGSVYENSPTNTTILTVASTDLDLTINVRYSLNLSLPNLPFKIDPLSGVITTSGSIDYEQLSFYEFSAFGIDPSNTMFSTTVIKIKVKGVNEYPPMFPSDIDTPIKVTSNMTKGEIVKNITAVDNDSGADGILIYSFLQPSQYFIMLSNGSIILNVTLEDLQSADAQKRESNDIVVTPTVVVMDNGTSPKNATATLTIIIPRYVAVSPTPISDSTITTEMIIIISCVTGGMLIIIVVVLFLIYGVTMKSRRLRKSTFDLQSNSPQTSTIGPDGESQRVELQQYTSNDNRLDTSTNRATSTELESNMKNGYRTGECTEEGDYPADVRRPSPRTRSTSDLASSVATDTLNLTQEASFPYPKGQIEAIYAANADLLHDGSQASVHTFGSEGGGEFDGDEFDNVYYSKYGDLDTEGSVMGGDDLSYCGKDRHSVISESSEGGREEEYHFSQSTNPWSSRRSINELGGESSRPMFFHYEPSQGPSVFGASTQGSSTSLIRQQHRRYGGSERELHHAHQHRAPSLPRAGYDYYTGESTPPRGIQPPLTHRNMRMGPPRHYTASPDYISPPRIPADPPPPPYFSQDPVHHGYSQGSRGNYYGHSPDPLRGSYDPRLLSTSNTSLSTSASNPYHRGGRGYPSEQNY